MVGNGEEQAGGRRWGKGRVERELMERKLVRAGGRKRRKGRSEDEEDEEEVEVTLVGSGRQRSSDGRYEKRPRADWPGGGRCARGCSQRKSCRCRCPSSFPSTCPLPAVNLGDREPSRRLPRLACGVHEQPPAGASATTDGIRGCQLLAVANMENVGRSTS